MSSPASIRKHPIHPMLVPLPIGLWIFSLVSDLVYAALPGFIDFLSLSGPRVKRVAMTHMVLNLTIVALYAVNLWLRTTSAPGAAAPLALSIVAVLMLAVSGWLGGELVFRHGVAVDRDSTMIG